MNALTRQFFQADFPGWQPRQDFDTVWQSFWTTREIPILELDLRLDVASSCDWIDQNQQQFVQAWNTRQVNHHYQTLGQGWFKQPHGQGRNDLQITGVYPQRRKLLDHTAWTEFDHEERDMHEDAVPDIRDQLEQLGFSIYSMKIASLEPGGYLEPHKDTLVSNQTMTHLWIPLNQTADNLKIWPYGMIQHQVGSVYLLNNQSFVHAIANFDQQTRYVITAKLDPEKTSAELVAKIRTALKQQWFSN
jgi:hypothetical protein